MDLVAKDIRPSHILTPKAFENAMMIHAAIGGSTNAVIHLPAIAGELGIELPLDLLEYDLRKSPPPGQYYGRLQLHHAGPG